MLDALEDAVLQTAVNISGYDENTKVVIAADVSGSMQTAMSARSKAQRFDIGLMLAMLLQSKCANVMTGMFGDSWKIINVPKKNILGNVMEFHRREGEVGYATNGYLVVQDLLRRNNVVDKIMVFTDCHCGTVRATIRWLMYGRSIRQLHPMQKCICSILAVMEILR